MVVALLAAVCIMLLLQRDATRSIRVDSRLYEDQPTADVRPQEDVAPRQGGIRQPEADEFVVRRGSVLDEAGAGIGGAALYVVPADFHSLTELQLRGFCRRTTSDDQGRFSIAARFEPEHILICRKPGFVPVARAVESLPEGELTIVLSRGQSIRGRVVTVGGRPVEGALVSARSCSVHRVHDEQATIPGADAIHSASVRSDARGHFEIAGLSEDLGYTVIAMATGFGMAKTPETGAVKPPSDIGAIVLVPIRVAVIKVRAGSVDLTAFTESRCLSGRRHVRYPDGFQLAYAGMPMTRFPPGVTSSLRRASADAFLLVARADRPTPGAAGGKLHATIPIMNLRDTVTDVQVELRPIGAPGWNRVQQVDVSPEGGLRPGRVEIHARGLDGETRTILMAFDQAGVGDESQRVFDLYRVGSSNRFRANLPAGQYEIAVLRVIRLGGALGHRRHRLDVASDADLRIEMDFTMPKLVVQPRYPSGAAAQDLGIAIVRPGAKGRRKWLAHIIEPFGCLDGPERIEITPEMHGRVQVILQKRGYMPLRETIELGPKDARFEPSLEAYDRGRFERRWR